MTKEPSQEHVGRCIRADIHVAAEPGQLWESWTDPERFCQWFSDEARGEARKGQTLTWIFRDFGFEMPLTVLDAKPSERLLLHSEPPGRPPNLQEVLFAEEKGGTRVTVLHSGFADGEAGEAEYVGCESGWKMALALLALYNESYFGQGRARFNVMSPADINPATIRESFCAEDKLSCWLTESGSLGVEGSDVDLRLKSGRNLTGKVLALSPTEALVSWNEINGNLIFKCFSAGEAGWILGLDGSGWGLAESEAQAIKSEMGEAILQLADLFGESSP